jgi:hypothetical protein
MKQIASPAFDKFSLLKHPFYRAWNDGNLTQTQIALYAREYGAFIRLISEGWERVRGTRALFIMEKICP